MTQALTETQQNYGVRPVTHEELAESIERVIVQGDLSKLSSADRVSYYERVCRSLGLNPLTKPFEYLNLQGKLVLYARKDCTDQLRNQRHVSCRVIGRELLDGLIVVTVQARMPDGREDEAVGVVAMPSGAGEIKANAFMKAETKAKRRVTLSICGLGFFDASEIEGDAMPSYEWDDAPPARPSRPATVADLYPDEISTVPMPESAAIPPKQRAEAGDRCPGCGDTDAWRNSFCVACGFTLGDDAQSGELPGFNAPNGHTDPADTRRGRR